MSVVNSLQESVHNVFDRFTGTKRTFTVQRIVVDDTTPSTMYTVHNRRIYFINPHDRPVIAGIIENMMQQSGLADHTPTDTDQDINQYLITVADGCSHCQSVTCAVTESDVGSISSMTRVAASTCPFTGSDTPPEDADHITHTTRIDCDHGETITRDHDSHTPHNVFNPSTTGQVSSCNRIVLHGEPDDASATLVSLIETLLQTADTAPATTNQPASPPGHTDVAHDRQSFDTESRTGARIEWVLHTLTDPRPAERIADAANVSRDEMNLIVFIYSTLDILQETEPGMYALDPDYESWLDDHEATHLPLYAFMHEHNPHHVANQVAELSDTISTL